MSQASAINWSVCQFYGHGRTAHGTALVSYDPAALRPSGGGAAVGAPAAGGGGQPDHVRASGAVRDRVAAAGGPPNPGADQRQAASPRPRRAESLAAHDAAVDAGAHGGRDPAGPGAGLAAGHRGRPGGRRRGDREAIREAVAVGGLDLLVRREAEGLRLPRGAAVLDQRPERSLAHPGRLPAVAPEAELRARPLSEEDRTGGRDAPRGGRGRLPGRVPGG